MKYLSLIEKIEILGEMFLNYKVVGIVTIIMIISTILYLVKVVNKKKYMIIMAVLMVLMIAISIASNYSTLNVTFDNFMKIFFKNVYFPSVYSYLLMMTLVFICFFVSVLNRTLNKSYKIINSIMFVINNIYTAIILNEIAKSKIDVFSPLSLYTNTNLVAVLELNVGTFILWIFGLIVVYITDVICDRIETRKKVMVTVETSEDDKIVDNVFDNKLAVTTLNETVPEMNYSQNVEDTVITYNDDKLEKTNSENRVTFNDILNGNLPVIECNSEINNDEYEIVNPEEIYDNKYNAAIDEINKNINLQDIVISTFDDNEREKVIKERLDINTVSLDELTDKKEDNIKENDITSIKEKTGGYTIEQYKKFIRMLEQLKIHTRSDVVNIDDAVAITLISNYSYDDCIMFKELLESNLK